MRYISSGVVSTKYLNHRIALTFIRQMSGARSARVPQEGPFWRAPRGPLEDAWGRFLGLFGVRWRPIGFFSNCRGRSCTALWPGRRARSIVWGKFASFVLEPLFAQPTSESSCSNFGPPVSTTSFPLSCIGNKEVLRRPLVRSIRQPKT